MSDYGSQGEYFLHIFIISCVRLIKYVYGIDNVLINVSFVGEQDIGECEEVTDYEISECDNRG